MPVRYDGDSGVDMGSFIRRAAFAMRFGQIEPLISNFVSDDTRVIYVRDVHDRSRRLRRSCDSTPTPTRSSSMAASTM